MTSDGQLQADGEKLAGRTAKLASNGDKEAVSVKTIAIIVAPFHAGAQCCRVGNGPDRLLKGGLIEGLRATGADTTLVEVGPVDVFDGEIGRSFEVKRRVAAAVAAAADARHFPLVLAGNRNVSVGAYAGLGDRDAEVMWFDAHPDLDTPDETMSGYFDGMGVATLAGQCWRGLASTIPGFHPFDLSRLTYCGIRDFEPGQREKVEAHGIRAIYGSTDQRVDFVGQLRAEFAAGPRRRALVHLDLDCLDTSVGHANDYAAPGGLSADDLDECTALVAVGTLPLGMTIASFDPALPGSDAVAAAGIRAAQAVTRAARDTRA